MNRRGFIGSIVAGMAALVCAPAAAWHRLRPREPRLVARCEFLGRGAYGWHTRPDNDYRKTVAKMAATHGIPAEQLAEIIDSESGNEVAGFDKPFQTGGLVSYIFSDPDRAIARGFLPDMEAEPLCGVQFYISAGTYADGAWYSCETGRFSSTRPNITNVPKSDPTWKARA